ncbi:enoyl-CoA hydratase/isomerase family protein [Arthrobacter sp. NPDC089319]|uniref:enoyl-CoA hydratase/isomerase family protein n=1 Tax=Arthrobacter sp. NPDC089319 TaxID=3155915 RepID=UPI00341DEF56
MLHGRDVLLTERIGHTYLLTINREERRNALSREFYARWDEELERFNEDDDLWVLVLTGAGDTAFSSGMDLREFTELQEGAVHTAAPARRKAHVWAPTWKPMIAAINGFALAGGWDIAQRCDLRIASEDARLGITEVRWNLHAPFIAENHTFPTRAIASEVALMGQQMTAQRAYEIGFVNKVVPQADVVPEALKWAEHICTLGQESVRKHKQLLYYGRILPQSEVSHLTDELFYWVGNKPGVVVDSAVGSRAFAAEEEPDFSSMFEPERLRCQVCGSEYLVAENGPRTSVECCSQSVRVVGGL